MKQWNAVHIRAGWEKKVARLLYKKSVENYFPLTKTVWQQGNRQKTTEELLFKSYVFVHIEEQERKVIRQTEGIINFVYRVDQPVVIKTEEISAMQNFLVTHENVMLQKISLKQLDGMHGDGQAYAGEAGVSDKPEVEKALLSSMGYVLVAEPSAAHKESAATSIMPYFKKPFYYYGAAVR